MNNLPTEMILTISKFLTDREIQSLMMINNKYYNALQGVFKKTHLYGRFLHNYFLAFYMCGCISLIDKTTLGKRYAMEKYCNISKLQRSIFVISRVGNIWSWKSFSLCGGTFKHISCQCESKYCNKENYVIETNLRDSTLRIAVKQNIWEEFIKNKIGFKKAFSDINLLLTQYPYS